jgi:hypothetical protein
MQIEKVQHQENGAFEKCHEYLTLLHTNLLKVHAVEMERLGNHHKPTRFCLKHEMLDGIVPPREP